MTWNFMLSHLLEPEYFNQELREITKNTHDSWAADICLQQRVRIHIGLGIVWIWSIPIQILLIDSDSYRFPVSIPVW